VKIETAWKMVLEEFIRYAGYFPNNPRVQQLRESKIVSWDEETSILSIKIDCPDWFNQRAAAIVNRLMIGILARADPRVIFISPS